MAKYDVDNKTFQSFPLFAYCFVCLVMPDIWKLLNCI